METLPKVMFETVKARIVSGDERQVVGVLGGGGCGRSLGGGDYGIAVFG